MSKHNTKLSRLLRLIAESLDISNTKYEEAVSRYQAVGKWLDADDSELHIFKPTIYPQGSFNLGTMIKPTNDGDEYDIDLVCHLEIDKNDISQNELKQMVGERLKENKNYDNILDEGRRCWILDYANEFHMDILPAIPDYEKLNDAILITDKELRNWQYSNPKGYERWFADRMKLMFTKRKELFAKSIRANVEDVPNYKIRTPLQRSIQILKWHRDLYFKGKKFKPISIIITTLAAQYYQNEDDLLDSITNIVSSIADINKLKSTEGRYYIPNPVNPDENFADKWNEEPELPLAFLKWLEQLQEDFSTASSQSNIYKIAESLSPSLGKKIVNGAMEKFAMIDENPRKIYPEIQFSAKPNKPWTR